jgi:hypothetical protein
MATAAPAISAGKVELVTLALNPIDLEKLMYLDSGTNFRLVLKNPRDKDTKVQTKGATERIVLSDIGHPDFVQQVMQPVSPTTIDKTPQVIVAPVDDGKVEIMYGAIARREIYKYGGPAAARFQNLQSNFPGSQAESGASMPVAGQPAAEE